MQKRFSRERRVLVVKREIIKGLPTRGLFGDLGLLHSLLRSSLFMEREAAERNPLYKQLIPYVVLRYRDQVFQYKRSGWGSERRLHKKRSIGIGGHVEESDAAHLWAHVETISVIEWARDREVNEEFVIPKDIILSVKFVALLNDDTTKVGSVHLGIVYEYQLAHPMVEPKEKRVHIQCKFMHIEELVAYKSEFEEWSQILIEDYLMKGG